MAKRYVRYVRHAATARAWIGTSLPSMGFDEAMVALEVARARLLNKWDLTTDQQADISQALTLLEKAREQLIERHEKQPSSYTAV